MLQIIAPGVIESKSIVPIGYVKIPIKVLNGYSNAAPEHLFIKNSSVIVASDNIKLSGTSNGEKVDSLQFSQNYKEVYLFPESDGEYCIAVEKYKITNITFASDVKHLAIDVQKLFDDFSSIEHIGPKNYFGSPIKNAMLNLDLINEYPPKLQTLILGGTQVSGDISNINNLINLTTLVLDNSKVTGSINSFNALTNLTSISISVEQVTGDIINLGSLVNLTNIGLGKSNISGTIESFVQAQRAAGRSSAQITGSSERWGNVTFDGSITKGTLSWTPTTITMNNKTINN